MEHDSVVEPLPRELLDVGHVVRRQVRTHFYDDAALGGLDDQGLRGIERTPIGGVDGAGEDQGGEGGEGADHARDYRRRASSHASQAY